MNSSPMVFLTVSASAPRTLRAQTTADSKLALPPSGRASVPPTTVPGAAMKSEAMVARCAEIEGLDAVLAQLEFASYEPRTAAWYAGRKHLEEVGVESALRKQMTPVEALAAAAVLVNAELAAQ